MKSERVHKIPWKQTLLMPRCCCRAEFCNAIHLLSLRESSDWRSTFNQRTVCAPPHFLGQPWLLRMAGPTVGVGVLFLLLSSSGFHTHDDLQVVLHLQHPQKRSQNASKVLQKKPPTRVVSVHAHRRHQQKPRTTVARHPRWQTTVSPVPRPCTGGKLRPQGPPERSHIPPR